SPSFGAIRHDVSDGGDVVLPRLGDAAAFDPRLSGTTTCPQQTEVRRRGRRRRSGRPSLARFEADDSRVALVHAPEGVPPAGDGLVSELVVDGVGGVRQLVRCGDGVGDGHWFFSWVMVLMASIRPAMVASKPLRVG